LSFGLQFQSGDFLRIGGSHNVLLDHCLIDEGLGDISSNASSPQPAINHQEELQQQKDKEIVKKKNTSVPLPQLGSPCDERMPSRIPLSVQTNF
jgi:hypothetical protein